MLLYYFVFLSYHLDNHLDLVLYFNWSLHLEASTLRDVIGHSTVIIYSASTCTTASLRLETTQNHLNYLSWKLLR